MAIQRRIKIFKGEIWHVTVNPFRLTHDNDNAKPDQCLEAFRQGAMAVSEEGTIQAIGDAELILAQYHGAPVTDFGRKLIIPGFIDCHLHFPQLDIMGCYGEQLLGWLKKYTFPAEAALSNPAAIKETAVRFLTELLANGVTASMVFAATSVLSADLLLEEAKSRGPRMIVGKVSMDRNAPRALIENAEADLESNKHLISKWLGKDDRLAIALTPRFAPACSEKLLEHLADLRAAYPDLYVQTHHAESPAEIAWVKSLFPNDSDYLAVYERFNLLGPKTVLAHCIHLTERERLKIAETKSKVAHCPTSNLFLGSGLFNMNSFAQQRITVGLGSDIGAGTSLSPWHTMAEAYKIQQLRGHSMSPVELFYLATLGGADCLGLPHVGNFEKGRKADFQVIDVSSHRLLSQRFEQTKSNLERLFALIMLGDDRVVEQVYVDGKEVYRKS